MSAGTDKWVSVMSMCSRHHAIDQRQDHLHKLLGDLEAMLVDRHNWFELTRIQRRELPAAQAFYDLEDELEALGHESAQLVIGLLNIRVTALHEAVAKLEVVARVIEPDDYPDAHAVLAAAIEELRDLSERYSHNPARRLPSRARRARGHDS